MQIRTAMTLIGIVLLLVSGYVDAYRPSRTLESFRYDFIEHVCEQEWRKRGRLRSDIRINVMYLRWRLHRPFGRSFELIWRNGFEPSDRDGKLKLFIWQGVCGQAARQKVTVFEDLRSEPGKPPSNPLETGTFTERWLWQNSYRLSYFQLRKTQQVRAILSIPMFDRHGAKGREVETCVGVINLDTKTDEGAQHLATKAKDLSDFFAKHGTLIAKMR